MGEWKAQISLRVRQALRTELEQMAARERRKLGNLGELVLEWGFEQLREAGSTERLLQCRLRLPEEPTQPRGGRRQSKAK
jgi:hypothetical protein